MPRTILGPVVTVPCLHTAVTTSLVTLNDGAAGLAAPTVGEQLEFVSSSINDAAAGTGARAYTFVYLDANGVVQSENGITNGITAVSSSATNVGQILDFYTLTYGSGGTNAGTCTMRKIGAAGNRVQIAAARQRAGVAQFRVPANHRFIFGGAAFSSANASGATPLKVSFVVEAEMLLATGEYVADAYVPIWFSTAGVTRGPMLASDASHRIIVPAWSNIRAKAQTDSATVEVSGHFWGRLVRDQYANIAADGVDP